VLHEFQSITGVVEDATDIILNLKQVPFKLAGEGPKALYLRADQPGVVTSGMIEADGDVEILDKNIYIATLSEGGKLDMEMRLKRGRGYISADKNFDADLGLGFIPVDSVHSPVRRVNYVVEAARLGQITDYDKLTLEVWTNGAVLPADAVGLAAKLLKDHMNIFINFEEEIEAEARGEEGRIAAAQRQPQPLGRRAGAVGPQLQLPEERQHSDHRRAGAEDRSRDAQDQELRPQEPERDQGNPRPDGPLAGHEDRRATATRFPDPPAFRPPPPWPPATATTTTRTSRWIRWICSCPPRPRTFKTDQGQLSGISQFRTSPTFETPLHSLPKTTEATPDP
jgi:hypothetical protein